MKQKILAAALLLALLLSGCGGEVPPPDEPSAAATSSPMPVPTPASTPAPEHQAEQFPYDYEETLADTEDFSLAVTGLGVDWENNWVVHLRLENRSNEIMNFRFLYQSINGLAIEDVLTYRVAIGGTLEPSFRILREEMAAWGFDEPVQWSFTLKVSSAESNREPYFFEELSAAPLGEKKAVRYEYFPDPTDTVVMDNDYATVYITGWEAAGGTLMIEYVAVSRSGQPLLLVLPEDEVVLDGKACPAYLKDSFGAYATLMGCIPIEGWSGDGRPQSVELCLALADPGAWGDPIIEDTEVSANIFS